jgi:hypothetical protein
MGSEERGRKVPQGGNCRSFSVGGVWVRKDAAEIFPKEKLRKSCGFRRNNCVWVRCEQNNGWLENAQTLHSEKPKRPVFDFFANNHPLLQPKKSRNGTHLFIVGALVLLGNEQFNSDLTQSELSLFLKCFWL